VLDDEAAIGERKVIECCTDPQCSFASQLEHDALLFGVVLLRISHPTGSIVVADLCLSSRASRLLAQMIECGVASDGDVPSDDTRIGRTLEAKATTSFVSAQQGRLDDVLERPGIADELRNPLTKHGYETTVHAGVGVRVSFDIRPHRFA
jgi:hypothetical protein